MVFRAQGQGLGAGQFANPDDIRPATANHAGLLSKADYTLLHQLTTGTAWAALPFAANWSDWGAGEATCGYRQDPTGRVWLKGLAKKSVALVASDIIGTLPTGFRPATEQIFATASFAGYTELRISTGGVVYIQSGGSASWTSLAGISFDPAQ